VITITPTTPPPVPASSEAPHSGGRLRNALTGGTNPGSLSSRLRRQRFAALSRTFPDLAEMRVVDLGGRPSMWDQLPVRPRHVVCVNLERHDPIGDWVTTETGDVCDPDVVGRLGTFDLVYSNSTIEHVGGHARRVQFADAVRSLAPRYWVQTPNRYFPIEPHAVFPGFQFLPARLKIAVAAHWPLSPLGTHGELAEEVLEIELVSLTELRFYFPGASIWKERVAGLTKSLTAYAAGPG
jgi:hypothetical protein